MRNLIRADIQFFITQLVICGNNCNVRRRLANLLFKKVVHKSFARIRARRFVQTQQSLSLTRGQDIDRVQL